MLNWSSWPMHSMDLLKVLVAEVEHSEIIWKWSLKWTRVFLTLHYFTRQIAESALKCVLWLWRSLFVLWLPGARIFLRKRRKCLSASRENGLNFSSQELRVKQKNNLFTIHQKRYISKLNKLSHDSPYFEFRSLCTKLLWIRNSRPNITSSVALDTEVTQKRFKKDKNG